MTLTAMIRIWLPPFDSGRTLRRLCAMTLSLLLLGPQGSAAADEKAANADVHREKAESYFETRVRPLLADHCFQCHGPDKQKGKLRLDSLTDMLSGGETGPAIVPGQPNDSLLIQAVRHESFEMPPDGKLEDAQIEVLSRWITDGAVWPGSEPGTAPIRRMAGEFTEEDKAWWAIQPLSMAEPPQVPEDPWSTSPIDQFVLGAMKAHKLEPAGPTSRTTLIRRAYFDLLGLPPSSAEVDEFVNDEHPDAWPRLVDRLLASPHYGERWARHWLDLVRYADSDGYRIDHYRPEAWRYRDYVIRSLNDDKPYDRFVQEQLAGDELFPDSADAKIATGFLRHWIYEYNSRDARGQWDIILNEVTDTTSDVFLGLGMQCARCHDHKYDPILQKDYFRLRAFFEPMIPRDVVVATAAETTEFEQKLAAWNAASAEIQKQIEALQLPVMERAKNDAITKFPEDVQKLIHTPESQRTARAQQIVELAWRQVLYEYEKLDDRFKDKSKERLLELRRQLAAHDALKPTPLPVAMTITDVSAVPPATVIPKKNMEVQPGFLSLLNAEPAAILPTANSATTGRRSALARWITDPSNVLTARVIVNRVWQYHFGRGLAENSSDLGTLGGPPSHPELLDWLTQQFIADGFHLKQLHRRILLTSTYCQSSGHRRMEEFQKIDPANRWLWRADTRRLDAEQIRDALLAVSGTLDLKAGGPGVQSDVPRRSIYLRFMRNERDSILDAFDLPLFFNSTSNRDTTTSPIQALMLFNSQTMLHHAQSFADRVRTAKMNPGDPTSRTTSLEPAVVAAWKLAYGREPDSHEVLLSLNFVAEQKKRIISESETATASNLVTSRLPYRDGQSIVLQPDSESPPLRIAHSLPLDLREFTVEAYFQVRSVYDSGAVRVIVSKWNGSHEVPGWSFGVTGQGSRRRPQTLVVQLMGTGPDGRLIEEPLFSDQHIALNTPYYAAVSVRMAQPQIAGEPRGDGRTGTATFYLKDLSNDDEPLQSATISHSITTGISNSLPVMIGRRAGRQEAEFDGLIDDIRLSRRALATGQLLFTSEGVNDETVGYWQFEANPGLLKDSSVNQLDVTSTDKAARQVDPQLAAFTDLCHIILNSNQFLYVE